jgi:hypothetical protein
MKTTKINYAILKTFCDRQNVSKLFEHRGFARSSQNLTVLIGDRKGLSISNAFETTPPFQWMIRKKAKPDQIESLVPTILEI